jgi:acyl carrier protein
MAATDTSAQSQQPATLEARVLEIVRELLIEQGKDRAANNLTMHSSFLRDLGLQSLDLVELVIRCEARLDLELPDEIAEQADTPAGWVRAIQQGSQETEAKSVYRIVPPDGKPPEAPHWAKNLVEVLRYHADAAPGRVHIHLIEEGNGQGITCAELLDAASHVARGLVSYGLKRDDRVAILLPNSADFYHAFYGIVLAGGIPVPLYPPASAERIAEYVDVQAGLLRNVGARCLIGFERVAPVSRILRAEVHGIEVTTVEALRRAGMRAPARMPEPSEFALIQYTSGSTGSPKAVALTHAAMLENIRGIGKAVEVRDDDAVVSWLPLGSDMGLVGCWLFSLYYGVPLTQLSPLEFMSRPETWLWAIHDSRGTLSAAPNFAFEHCTRRIPMWTLEGIDLSSWRVAAIAGEPVLAETMERFTKRFAFTGLRSEAIMPCYGLAENTVALALPPVGRGPVKLAGEAFSVGSPIAGHEVRVVDEEGRDVADGVEGRIEFRGPCRFAGYWKDGRLVAPGADGGWVDTGDLGVLRDGELAVTGRVKETILKEGRSLAPQYIESAVDGVPGVQPAGVIAIGIPDPAAGTERLVLLVESAAETDADIRGVKARVMAAATKAGTPPDEIVLVGPRTLPKTSNLKLRRAAARQLYRAGEIGLEPPAPWVQMGGLWRRNFAALSGRGLKRAAAAGRRGVVRAMAATIAVLGGCIARVPGCRSVVGSTARAALGLLGRSAKREGSAPAAGTIVVANRCSHLDPVTLVAAIAGQAGLCGEEALAGLRGWAAFLLRPIVVRRTDAKKALKSGHTLILLPDGPVGASAARSRFRLDGLEAALDNQTPLVPVAVLEVRGNTILRFGNALTECGGDARTARARVREAVGFLFSE